MFCLKLKNRSFIYIVCDEYYMNWKRVATVGSIGAIGYLVWKRTRATPSEKRKVRVYPKSIYERFGRRVLYESSTLEMMFPQNFHTTDFEVYGPNDYPSLAMAKELLDTVEPTDDWSTVESGELYRVSGEVRIEPDDDTDFYRSTLETDAGVTLSAYGSIENYSNMVQSIISEHGLYTNENVVSIAEVQAKEDGASEPDAVHFHTVVIDE